MAETSPAKTNEEKPRLYSEETEKIIASFASTSSSSQLAGTTLDDESLVARINELFPTEQSLNQLEQVMASVKNELSSLDDELADLIDTHAEVGGRGEAALLEAETAMRELEQRIDSIRGRTRASDAVVREMTRDIKQLDIAKTNLTTSITTLHHLHILLTGVESLGTWVAERKYGDIAAQFPIVLNVLQLFDGYKQVEQIASLFEKVDRLRDQLTLHLAQDIKQAFVGTTLRVAAPRMSEMCRVAGVLGEPMRSRFIHWYLERQLAEYGVLYADNEEAGWLDKIENRYKWFVRRLADLESSGQLAVFPADWMMARRLATAFCRQTREILSRAMARRRAELDWRQLVHAIQHTAMFEQLLVKRFPPLEGKDKPEEPKDETEASVSAAPTFDKLVWHVFDPHMDVFVAAQQRTLLEFVEGCVQKIRAGTERPAREASACAVPLPSSADLFLLLKKVVQESSRLSAEPDALLSRLADVFRRCLRSYAHSCLTAFLPGYTASSASATFLSGSAGRDGASSSDEQSFHAPVASSSASLLQSLLVRDDPAAAVRLTADQQFWACCLLSTADWCAETTQQLQDKLKQRVQSVDLSQESELFYSIANSSLGVLVADVDAGCDAALQAMTKQNWSTLSTVGDESAWVGALRQKLRAALPPLRDHLSERRKYYAHLCVKLAGLLTAKYLGALYRCRPISVTGAEQLLLDTHALKTFLLTLPSVDSRVVAARPPALYTQHVQKAMQRAELVLKMVMSDVTAPRDLVDQFRRLLPDADAAELQKILEMRGMRRADQLPILQQLRAEAEQQKGGRSEDARVPSPSVSLAAPAAPSSVSVGGIHVSASSAALAEAAAASASQAASALAAHTGAALQQVVGQLADTRLGDHSSIRRLEQLVKRKL